VRRCALSVQEPRRGEDERPGADRRDTGSLASRTPDRVEDPLRDGQLRLFDAGNDHQIGVGDVIERPRGSDAVCDGADLRRLAADAHTVSGPTLGHLNPPEHVTRDSQIERHGAVHRQDRDVDHRAPSIAPVAFLR